MPKSSLTQKQLKEILHYNPETGIFTWLVKTANRIKIGDVAGSTNSCGYISIKIKYNRYLAHRLAWLYMTGGWPKHQIDHIDHIRNNNRWVNFRGATHQENHKNQSLPKNNISGICGVFWENRAKKWRAQITVSGKKSCLGCFSSKAGAIKARKEAEIKYGYHENHGSPKI